MLEFAEAVFREIRNLRESSEQVVLNGSISDMEQYRFMMGRIESLKLIEDSVKKILKSYTKEDGF